LTPVIDDKASTMVVASVRGPQRLEVSVSDDQVPIILHEDFMGVADAGGPNFV
jgi:hypothetical protein